MFENFYKTELSNEVTRFDKLSTNSTPAYKAIAMRRFETLQKFLDGSKLEETNDICEWME